MPILKLHLENVGPFDKLELDLTDGNGKAHLGPHILAGVNGSGKTTVLRAIAWCLERGTSGFDRGSWSEFLGGRNCVAELFIGDSAGRASSRRRALQSAIETDLAPERFELGCVATYSPRPRLLRMHQPPMGVSERAREKWLSFDDTVSNEEVNAYWAGAFSKEALAKTQGKANGQFARTVADLRRSVQQILGADFEPSVDIAGPFVQPSLRFRGIDLSLSQLAAGFNATLGWVVDYLLRQELFLWSDEQRDRRPGVILIDEIETHLHPQWQRRILNGIRAAFPNTPIIVTTHSPFVVSSCPGARLHQFKLKDEGGAYLDESTDAPDAASISANIMDVFGIRSEFSFSIEQKLDRWNDLKRRRSAGKLTPQEDSELRGLITELAAKGEELSSIVAEPPVLPQSIIDELVSSVNKHR